MLLRDCVCSKAAATKLQATQRGKMARREMPHPGSRYRKDIDEFTHTQEMYQDQERAATMIQVRALPNPQQQHYFSRDQAPVIDLYSLMHS